MRGRLVGKAYVRAVSTGAIAVVALAGASSLPPALSETTSDEHGDGRPCALVNAYDRFAAARRRRM